MLLCSTCDIELTEDNWKPGVRRCRQRICNMCNLDKLKEWTKNNPLKYQAKVMINNARHRSKGRFGPPTIDKDWLVEILVEGTCQKTGIEFVLPEGKRCRHIFSPSLDRIDCNKGYTPENTQVVVWGLNALRQDFSNPDIAVLLEAVMARGIFNGAALESA